MCKLLPPILAHQFQAHLVTFSQAAKKPFFFKSKSFTGGYLQGYTNDVLAFKFFIHGYFDWRNIILAKAILKIKKGDIIEVGANIGTETVSLAEINSGNVYAFEPLLKNFKSLQFIKESNDYKNLFLFKTLVSDKEGKAWFVNPEKNNSGTGYISNVKSQEANEIEVTTLDRKLSTMSSCAIIFIDVEGFEWNVLMGGEQIIKKLRPFIILEVNSKYLEERANINIEKLFKFFNNNSYDCFSIERVGLKEIKAENFKFKTNDNWLCVPREHKKIKKYLSRRLAWNAINPFFSFCYKIK